MKRSLTLDFLRGFAIFMMIILHVIQHNWVGLENVTNLDFVLSLPIYYIAPIVLLAYLGSWAGLFLLISMSVNVIAVERRLEEGVQLEKMRNKQILTGVIVLALAYFTEMFTAYHGLIGMIFREKEFTLIGLYWGIFNWETLNAIGISIIITSLVVYLLYRNGGNKKVRRNIIILSILAFTVLILTPIIDWSINTYIYSWWSVHDSTTQYQWPVASIGDFLLRFFLIPINGHLEPIFPFMSTAFIGTIFGIFLSQERPPKYFPLWGILSGFASILLAVVLVMLGIEINPSLGYRPDIPWFLIGLGGQLITVSFFLWLVEFKGYTQPFKKISTFWRRWGMMALTIYCWQIIDIPLRYLVYLLFGWDAHLRNTLVVEQTVVMILLTIIWWDVILRLWSKVDFKYSYEWLIVRTMTRSQGIKSARTQVDEVIHNVEPMDFSSLYKDDFKQREVTVDRHNVRISLVSYVMLSLILSIVLIQLGF